jgi:RHS repeat-associated protein
VLSFIASFTLLVLASGITCSYGDDGLILARYARGLTNQALITGTRADQNPANLATVINAINAHMSAYTSAHDIDASGGSISVNDALIINRYLAGFRGNALTQGLNLTGTRTNANDIQTYLNNGCPASGTTVSTTYLHPNVTGSAIMATDANGDPAWFENYSAFGERLKNEANANAGSNNNQNWFIGKPVDAITGLVYFGGRWYDPQIARFLGFDPAPVDEANPHSFNRYAYGNNNPYKYLDPDGHEAARIESSALMLAVMPGQGHFDTARNAFANEQYGKAAVFAAAMVVEQAMAVATLGEAFAGRAVLGGAAAVATKAAEPAVVANSTSRTGNNLSSQARAELQKSKASYEKLISEHQQKLSDYKANPFAHDNQGKHKKCQARAPPKNHRWKIEYTRERH